MKKLTCTALILLNLSANVMGASAASTADANVTASTSFKDYYNKLKESPFGLLVLNETLVKRKVNGLLSDTLFYMDYKFGDNKVSVIPAVSIVHTGNSGTKDAHMEYAYTQLRYTRYNLLTEEENGVKLNAQVRAYINNDDSRKKGNDTVLRPKIELKKSWGKLTLFNDTSFYMYQNNENATNKSKETRLLVQVTPAYQITDKLAVSMDFISYTESFKDSETLQKIRMISNVSYDFDSGIGLTAYLDTTPLSSEGKASMERVDGWAKDASIGSVLTYKFF